ncbi:hypothetical protein GCM10009663_32770 [Kitasatospora arboriphila]|uniref:Response regulator n=1 Tax=Kitasatospora arboriphila TaxID=258052 RepID=A0ABP4E2H7_9ACTN
MSGTVQTAGGAAAPGEAFLLVVDDEPNIRELLSASLRFSGFRVASAPPSPPNGPTSSSST